MLIKSILFLFLMFNTTSCTQETVLSNPVDEITDSSAVILKDDFEILSNTWEYGYGTWSIKTDGINHILVHNSSETYGVALNKVNLFKDIDITVRFRPVDGSTDQAGGIIFRATDKDNYYLVRANGLESNIGFYKTTNGNRETLKSNNATKPSQNQWSFLRVIMKGTHVQAWLNGKLLIDENESSLKSGYVGLWTKADSKTDFDDFSVKGVK